MGMLLSLQEYQHHFRTNVIGVSIAKTEFGAVAQQNLRYANVESIRVSIAASETPQPTVVSSFTGTYNTAYYLVQCVGFNTVTSETTTQFTELITLNNSFDATIVWNMGKLMLMKNWALLMSTHQY